MDNSTLDTMKLRDMIEVPELPSPIEAVMKQTMDGLHKKEMAGRAVVINELGEDRVCYCHGVENDNGTLYWQFADSNGCTWQIPVDELTPRLATDAEMAASYIRECKAVAKQEYE